MLLCAVKGMGGGLLVSSSAVMVMDHDGRGGCDQYLVDLAGQVALEAADDLGLGEALCGAAVEVVTGARVAADPGERHGVEGIVGAAVAATVEPVAVGLCRCWRGLGRPRTGGRTLLLSASGRGCPRRLVRSCPRPRLRRRPG